MNTWQRIIAAVAVIAMGVTMTGCGGSSGGGDNRAGQSGSSSSAGDDTSGGDDSAGGVSSCDALTALVSKDLGVTGKVKKTTDPSSDLHCNYGYEDAMHPGTTVEVWSGGGAGTDMLEANEEHMVDPADVSGVGDAAFVSDAGGGQHVLGAAKGDTMVIVIGPGGTDELGTFAGDLLAQVG